MKRLLKKIRDLLTMDVGIFALRRIVNNLDGAPFKLSHLAGKGGYTVFSARGGDDKARYIIKVSNSFKGGITKRVIEKKRTQYVYLKPSDRFERENKVLGILSKKNLSPRPVLFSGRYSIEEHIAGEKFSDIFAVDAENIGPLLGKVVDAVSNMHSLGVVHGDLRPYNVLVDGEHIRFIDFEHMLDPGKFTEPEMRAFDYLILLYELRRIDKKGILRENAGSIRNEISRFIPRSFTRDDVVKVREEFGYAKDFDRYFF